MEPILIQDIINEKKKNPNTSKSKLKQLEELEKLIKLHKANKL